LFGDIWPHVGEFGIQLEEYFLTCGNFVFGVDCTGGTFWFTESTVNAFVRVNDEEVRSLVKTVYRAYLYTVCVFAFNAVVSNDKSHFDVSC
jgi:hypothetical protein